ncbi:MAG: beta-lactamase family protein, partial [Demequinaceae bacterium]|nr:beta-lactamase family protein [Demequinaceae bacterium]
MIAPTHTSLQEVADAARQPLGSTAAGAAVVTPDGETTIAVSGLRRPGGDPVQLTDRWHVGSTFKAIHALLYARLVEQGRAAWGTPVADLFPDLAADAAPGWEAPTVDEMFTCQAGMRGNPTIREMLAGWKDTRPLVEQRTEVAVKGMAIPPKNRGQFVYSNLGYTVLGAAIDRIAGKPFEEVLDEEIFTPLGVTSAGWGPPPEIWGRGGLIMFGGLIAGPGKPADPTDPRSDNPALISPAGRLHLSLADWAKIQHVFISGGGGLVSPESIERLFVIPEGNHMSAGWAASKVPGVFRGQQGSNGR